MMINAKGLIAGRLASKVAKKLIDGEEIIILNAEEAIIVGKKEDILKKYKTRVDAAVHSNPHYGPKYDRIPNKMLKKMIRGMLPNKSRTRERQLKSLKIYNGVPKQYQEKETEIIKEIIFNEKHNSMKLEKVAKLLGGKW